jgi:ribosomal protein L1
VSGAERSESSGEVQLEKYCDVPSKVRLLTILNLPSKSNDRKSIIVIARGEKRKEAKFSSDNNCRKYLHNLNQN